ncbi:MAG TPA: hypothetical protein VJZ26_01300 [Blastocatellia bacterium]|nr:hypothetical protein [Blastocatellia bacterium]
MTGRSYKRHAASAAADRRRPGKLWSAARARVSHPPPIACHLGSVALESLREID